LLKNTKYQWMNRIGCIKHVFSMPQEMERTNFFNTYSLSQS
jgi:hypothetical protein